MEMSLGATELSVCFSVLADETTDISVTEQLALCVNESFLKFIQVHSLSGKNLADSILNGLISCGIDCDFLYGQGDDGASNMSGQFQGVQAHIRSKYPKALYVHCAAHSLNLAVSTASNIKPVRNCLGIIEKLYVFFNTPKRNAVLLSAIENSNTDQKVKTLKRLSATRWVQRYDSVRDFIELFEFVVNALECITEWNDSSATDATLLLKSFDSEFIISVNIVQLMFSFGLPLCKQLQKINIDLKEAINLAQDTVDELKTIRNNCDDEFNNIFSKAKKMADKVEVELKYKRLGKRQTNRANPLTDQTISVLDVCFQVDKNNSLTELRLWRTKLRRTSCIPKTGIDALTECNKEILYPNIYLLLKILCALPVSTTTPERMFSALKRVKTYLRNTMTEDRLNGLSMLAVHRDIKVSPEDVLDDIAKRPRKLDLVL
ncbi:52 kDa repressor of the inhibitor of the protein kinase-like [Acyrthosiphon pisum]|uniref:HAT C-terminal dimerisation domain-containing protein n=1 Tax=Acyrthosiphon pisum TaxID=7029 RepID=A0A8R2FA76_ACYPI|nr:52 kDa repressor of the inhibitor of the protein kinase-like [Acyrthosiphon pisum]|eukprot:XP_008184846.1 PREDICTED: 52 kDa repressor of the inhibitor of the protein kinase-like [Acyrthosiphon pisum]